MSMDTFMDTECLATEIYTNISSDELLALSLLQREGVLASNGALAVDTGFRKAGSPQDRFIVKDGVTENQITWGVHNQAFEKEKFNELWERAEAYLKQHDAYIQDVRTGGKDSYSIPIKVVCEYAWHALFCRMMYIHDEWDGRDERVAWTLINVPGFKTDLERDGVNSDAAIILNFSQKKILICGTQYAGEIKRAIFSVLNFILPAADVLPVRCAANIGKNGDVALFFGLSGAGKTTLSADNERFLIGDDEFGWSTEEIFNIEAGCYVRGLNLSAEKDPLIWGAIKQGAIMENVAVDPVSHLPNFNTSAGQNSRIAYPKEYLANIVAENKTKTPSTIIFLTCDLYGVLPAVAKLTKEQAVYHFLTGYTSLINETEEGSYVIAPLFSACFGEPFFLKDPHIYANLFSKHLEGMDDNIYLVNTGCLGGVCGNGGERFPLTITRTIIHAILNSELNNVDYEILAGFNLAIPKAVKGIDSTLLNPQNKWNNVSEYEETLKTLLEKFEENFQKFRVEQ